MTDDALRTLAVAAGFAPRWTDNDGVEQTVAPDILRAALFALGIPAASAGDIADSRARLAAEQANATLPPLVTCVAGEPIVLVVAPTGERYARVEFEQGGACDLPLATDDGALRLPPIARAGYHRLFVGDAEITLAVTPRAAHSLGEASAGARAWGLAAQIYGLRSKGDCGIGAFGAVAQLAESAARRGADLLALSPAHALFLADENHYTPYSPSSRLFYNALHADPALVFGDARVAALRTSLAIDDAATESLIDWPTASRAKTKLLSALHADFFTRESGDDLALARDFQRFRIEGGRALAQHAIFEALHARQFEADFTQWNWRDWPAELRDARSQAVCDFAREKADDVAFHVFAQWLADRSMARAQGRARAAGMRVGLVSDLAVGMNAGGSHAWANPHDLLLGLSIGAPPDALAPLGQNWGLTTFSPRALRETGYAPFLATLRAALRNAGGVRIDHVLGLVRLWLVPDGARATQGVYLSYPTDDLIALIRLESARHDAIVIGEDLGTAPHGLRGKLADSAIAGMRILQFERDGQRFYPPHWYPEGAVAMTATHDTATVAGWWRGLDLVRREETAQLPAGKTRADCEAERANERDMIWSAFAEAGATEAPAPPLDQPQPVVDAALRFIAATPAKLVVLPLEDALGLEEQPNLPGTTTEHPNWRRRYPGEAADLLDAPEVAARLTEFDRRRRG